jgi:hypothetical protein
MGNSKQLVPAEIIESKIYLICAQKVMLSPHLAGLYDVEPRALVQAGEIRGHLTVFHWQAKEQGDQLGTFMN